jgi:hypothetical protein
MINMSNTYKYRAINFLILDSAYKVGVTPSGAYWPTLVTYRRWRGGSKGETEGGDFRFRDGEATKSQEIG